MFSPELSQRDKILINFRVIQETLLHLSIKTNDKDLLFEHNKYAEGLVRKVNLQLMTIRNIYEKGEWHSALDDKQYQYIIDPLTVATVLRGAYECMLTLNHVFIDPPGEDEVELRYKLWLLSTLISKDQSKPALFKDGQDRREENRGNITD